MRNQEQTLWGHKTPPPSLWEEIPKWLEVASFRDYCTAPPSPERPNNIQPENNPGLAESVFCLNNCFVSKDQDLRLSTQTIIPLTETVLNLDGSLKVNFENMATLVSFFIRVKKEQHKLTESALKSLSLPINIFLWDWLF